MPAPLRTLALLLAGPLAACFPPMVELCAESGCTATEPPTSTGDPTIPTGGDEQGAPSGTGDVDVTTGDASDPSATVGDSTPTDGPLILDVGIDPNPLTVNGLIDVDVGTRHADSVRMQLEGGTLVDLTPDGKDRFHGQIPAFTGYANGTYPAVLTPGRDALEGPAVEREYTIALPEPGSQSFWETGDVIGIGNIVAIEVLPDGGVVELGNFFEQDEPRCYLRRRDKKGAWSDEDLVPVLPTSHCVAIDLQIDPNLGTLHVLAYRKTEKEEQRWWLGEISTWGKGAKNIALGVIGDTAEALAWSPEAIAVCGGRKAPTLDLDAAAWLLRPGQPLESLQFDYVPEFMAENPHRFNESARDCIFADETLILVGEANGKHSADPNELKRDRLFIVEQGIRGQAPIWSVAPPGPGTQSRAFAVDVDAEGRYLLAGYTCGDVCKPDGEIRIYSPGGKLDWQATLGPLEQELAGPHDIAWTPAGYIVVALGEFHEDSLRFNVRAFSPHVYEPLWNFIPAEIGFQVAMALAIGKFGEIYAGGLGAGSYPAFAIIAG